MDFSAAESARFEELIDALTDHRRAHWDKLMPKDKECLIVEYADLVLEVGIERVCAGLRKIFTWHKFLPSAAETRQYLPPVPDIPKPRVEPDPACPDCNGTWWKFVTVHSNLYGRDERRATRCDCHTRPHRPAVVADAASAA